MEELNLSSHWLDYVSAPSLPLFLFAVVLTALYEIKHWRPFLSISLALLVALVVSVFVNLGGVYAIAGPQSAAVCAALMFLVAVLALVLKGKRGKVWLVFAAAIGVANGLNKHILQKAFYEKVNVWQDAPLLVVKIMAGFMFTYLAVQLFSWLLKTAFSIADRDRLLVVCGLVLGAAALHLTQLFYQIG